MMLFPRVLWMDHGRLGASGRGTDLNTNDSEGEMGKDQINNWRLSRWSVQPRRKFCAAARKVAALVQSKEQAGMIAKGVPVYLKGLRG